MASAPDPLAVLVVDDEEGFRHWLSWELSSRGLYVDTAANGVEGALKIRERHFDVMVTDIAMPEMDGLKLLQDVRQCSPDTEVIVTSGFSTADTVVFAMRKGAADFITKPYELNQLVQRLETALARAADRRSHAGGGAQSA